MDKLFIALAKKNQAACLMVGHGMNFQDRDLSCAKWLYLTIAEVWPQTPEPDFNPWAEVIHTMRQQDQRTYQQIHQVFTWAMNESYIDPTFTPTYLRDNFINLTNIMIRKSRRIIPPPEYYENLKNAGMKITPKSKKP